MPSESQKQFVPIAGSEPLEIVRSEGEWRAAGVAVRNGSCISRDGVDLLLEFVGGRWRLAEYTVETVLAGKRLEPGRATEMALRCPSRVAADRLGNVYVAEPERHVVWKIDSRGLIAPLAGTGRPGYAGDDGPANDALLDGPHGLATDPNGNVFIADSFNHRIRKVDPSGRIETVAGTGVAGCGGDGGPATEAVLRRPAGVAVGAGGDLLVADTGNNRIRRIDAAGAITTLAGAGAMGFGGDGGPAAEAALMWPRSVAADAAGNVYVPDIRHFRIRKIDTRRIITTVAGTGEPGHSGDGGPATEAKLGWLGGLALDGAGNLFVADRGNVCVRMIDTTGVIRTVSGDPSGKLRPSAVGIGEAMLNAADGFAIDLAGNLYLADRYGHRVRRVTPDGTVATVAGTGTPGYAGDEGPATEALLRRPCDVASDLAGNLYIADSRNNRIRRIEPSGRIAAAAGSGRWGHGMDDDPATETLLDTPERVMAGMKGDFYLSGNDSGIDTSNSRVYQVSTGGRISTAARPGDSRFWPDRDPIPDTSLDAERLAAELDAGNLTADRYHDLVRRIDTDGFVKTAAIVPGRSHWASAPPSPAVPLAPCDIATDGAGSIVLADRDGANVLRLYGGGTTTTVAGITAKEGQRALDPEDGARLEQLGGITLDNDGNAYFVASRRVWKLDASGAATPFAGTGAEGYWGDGGPATAAGLDGAAGLAADAEGNVYVTETRNRRVRRIDRSGIITTVAGTRASARSSQCGPSHMHMACPAGLVVDAEGNIFVNDGEDDRVWRIDPSGAVTQVPGTGEAHDSGDGDPSGMAVDSKGNVYVADAAHPRVRKITRSGIVTTVAGTGEGGYSGDGGPAVQAELGWPYAIAVDGSGTLYVADYLCDVIRKVDTAGTITTFAGPGSERSSGDGGQAIGAALDGPSGLALDREGNLYVAEGRRIRRIDSAGIITTVAGTGEMATGGNGSPEILAQFMAPSAIAFDNEGNLFVAESVDRYVDEPNWIRKIAPNGVITVFAGTIERGYAGDGGPVSEALFDQPNGVAFDSAGNMYVADGRNARVRKIDRNGTITTIAGYPVRPGHRGDGQASEAELGCPTDVAVDREGTVYLADAEDSRVRKIDSSGMITTLVDERTAANRKPPWLQHQNAEVFGDRTSSREALEALPGVPEAQTDDALPCDQDPLQRQEETGPEESAGRQAPTSAPSAGDCGVRRPDGKRPPMRPSSIAVDQAGNVYVADRRNHRVFRIDPAGTVLTLAGTGEAGHSGDGEPAVKARIQAEHVTVDAEGNVYVAGGNRVRRIDLSGTITTVAGTGSDRSSGNSSAAAATGLSVSGIVAGPSGNLWIADRENRQIRVLRRFRSRPVADG